MSQDGPESGHEHGIMGSSGKINGMDDNLLAKIAKNGKPNIRGSSGLGAKVGYHRRTSTLDKIQEVAL